MLHTHIVKFDVIDAVPLFGKSFSTKHGPKLGKRVLGAVYICTLHATPWTTVGGGGHLEICAES